MENNLDKVIEKIQKLKALYENAKEINSEGEAANAAYLMQKLLAEYNLTIDEVDEHNKPSNEVMNEDVSGYTYRSIGGVWEMKLYVVLSRWNFCRILKRGTKNNLVIIGRKDNVEMVKWLKSMLGDRYVAMSKDRYKEYVASNPFKVMTKEAYQRNYLLGCVIGLNEKLEEEHRREKQEEAELSSRISALVVRANADIDEHIAKVFGELRNGRSYSYRLNSANEAGRRDGRNTELHRPIASGRSAVNKQLLLK